MNPKVRAQVLAEWRRAAEPVIRMAQPVPIGREVMRLMNSLGLGERLRQEEVLRTWKEIVGDFIAAHSQPTRLQDGVLYVRVLQPTMHYELDRFWKQKILQKMRERFGTKTVRDIKFRVG